MKSILGALLILAAPLLSQAATNSYLCEISRQDKLKKTLTTVAYLEVNTDNAAEQTGILKVLEKEQGILVSDKIVFAL